jgi:hypothetical protein
MHPALDATRSSDTGLIERDQPTSDNRLNVLYEACAGSPLWLVRPVRVQPGSDRDSSVARQSAFSHALLKGRSLSSDERHSTTRVKLLRRSLEIVSQFA